MMMAAWMGSHFTNDDLVKESRLIRDYDITIGFSGARDGVEVWGIRADPAAGRGGRLGPDRARGAAEGPHADLGGVAPPSRRMGDEP